MSIELFPLAPCQLLKLHGLVAQNFVELPLNVTVPAASMTPVPVYVPDCEIVRFPSRKTFPLTVSCFVVLFQVSWPTDEPLCEMQV